MQGFEQVDAVSHDGSNVDEVSCVGVRFLRENAVSIRVNLKESFPYVIELFAQVNEPLLQVFNVNRVFILQENISFSVACQVKLSSKVSRTAGKISISDVYLPLSFSVETRNTKSTRACLMFSVSCAESLRVSSKEAGHIDLP